MMRNYILHAFLTCFVLTSCQILGLTSGYTHLSKREQEKVIHYKGNIDSISDYANVYAVTVEQVKEYVLTHKKVIVYDYTPFCKSPFCTSPTALTKRYKAKGIDVLVISNIYDDIFKSVNKEFPMLMIDTKEYKTKWRGKYIDSFYFALTGLTLKEVNYALYHYFRNGTYVKSFKDPKEIEKEIE